VELDGSRAALADSDGVGSSTVAPWVHLTGASVEQAKERVSTGFSVQNNAVAKRILT
jgi:hypothetical protein